MKLLLFVTFCGILGVSSSQDQQDFSPFMINGARAPVAPYFAHIQYFNILNAGFFGGGSLISTRHILTAATNLQGFTRFTVHMGSSNRTAMMNLPTVLPVSIHTDFNPQTRANDIGILRLQNPIVPTAMIHPIQLPPLETPNVVLPFENEEGATAGFGFTSVQSQGPTPFLYRGFQRAIASGRCALFFNHNPVTAFCAEDNVERSAGCNGDVGNPFVLSYRRQETLVGLLSMHPQCGIMAPSAYTRVSAYLVWINQQLLS